MVLDKLENGKLVNLELVTEDEKYEMTSVIAGVSKNALLIEPLAESAKKDEFRNNEHTVYNLYADDSDGKRVGWHNVTVRIIHYKDHDYRGIYTRPFQQDSTQSDRRDNDRLRIEDMSVQIETSDGAQYEATLYDLSNNGIAFVSGEDDFLNKRLLVRLVDFVNGEPLSLQIPCRCVRCCTKNGTHLFGCSIAEPNRNFLTYLFEKRMEARMPKEEGAF